MYFKRKIDSQLDKWLKSENESPALIVGIRQCGKTETIKEFAKRNKLNLIEINFWTNPEFGSDFEGSLDVDNIISNISLRFPKHKINSNSLIFFDEIQDCPKARLSFKNFKNDGRYRVIASGSYLGVNGYVVSDATPTPVGYESIFQMKTMDFEEFLWANGYSETQIEQPIYFFEKAEKIPDHIHNLFKSLFLNYACIGGFPMVVKKYLAQKNFVDAFNELNNIVFDLKSDFGRRKDKNGNPVFKQAEVSRIQSAFDLIPTFMSKESKRYIVSKINGGTQYDKNDAIEYLRQAHVVSKIYNVTTPSLPLAAEKIESQFKLYPEDIGIAISMFGLDTISAILKNNLGQGKGAIYEALVFDSLNKAGIETYYFAKESGLKIDFVITYNGYATLIEAKAKNGNTKSSKTVMKHEEHYGKTRLIKIGDYNVSRVENIITIPHYLTFALGKKPDF